MRKSLLIVTVVCFTATMFATSTMGGASEFPSTKGLSVKSFIPLPARALVDGSISFTPLSPIAARAISMSPQIALSDLKSQFTMPKGSWVYSVSLGGYVNKLDIVHDWSGTKSKWPKRVAIYMITVHGLNLSPDGPSKISAVNHEEIFIVNATTGKLESSFTYH